MTTDNMNTIKGTRHDDRRRVPDRQGIGQPSLTILETGSKKVNNLFFNKT